jgi:2-iminobutanoate/2-iminopropanoate deaminase
MRAGRGCAAMWMERRSDAPQEGSRAMSKDVIATSSAPAAIGPYSQAIKANGFLFTAGQIPLDPASGTIVEGDITAQAERVMQNLAAILAAAGTGFDRVVKTTCFLANLDHFADFNKVYAGYFTNQPPARSTVQVARLPAGALVEVECVALCD